MTLATLDVESVTFERYQRPRGCTGGFRRHSDEATHAPTTGVHCLRVSETHNSVTGVLVGLDRILNLSEGHDRSVQGPSVPLICRNQIRVWNIRISHRTMPKRVQRDHWSEAQEVQTGDQLRLLLLSTIHEEGADVGSRPATKRKRIPKSKFRRSGFRDG